MKRVFPLFLIFVLLVALFSVTSVEAEQIQPQRIFTNYVSGFDFGDVDNDGQEELVLTSPKEKAVVVLDEQYLEEYRFTFNEAPRDVVVADFKGDGTNRLAVGTSGTNPAPTTCTIPPDGGGCLTGLGAEDGGFIYIGQVQNGSFAQEWKSDHLWIRFASELTSTDFNNDGKEELIAALTWYSRRLDVYEWNGQTYAIKVRDGIGSDVNSAYVAGDMLAVGTSCYSDYALRVYNPNYQLVFRDSNGRSNYVSAGDVDGDGLIEIISDLGTNCATPPDYNAQELRIYQRDGITFTPEVIAAGADLSQNGFTDRIWSTTGELFAGGGEEIALGTFSYMSYQDSGYENVRIFQYDNVTSTYQEVWQGDFDQLEEDAYELKIYDFDQDGKNELFVSTTYGLSVYSFMPPTPTDNTPPEIVANVSGTLGNNGWYVSDVTVSWTVTDPDSPVSSTTGCETTIINADTAETILTCTATSEGGTASESMTIKRDATPPTISGSTAPPPNSNGWNNSDVTVTFTCADDLSGMATCGPNQTLNSDGANQSVTGTATDNAGNSASNIVGGINLDKTPPTVSVTGITDGATYSLGQVPAGGCDTQDSLSGVATQATFSLSGGNANGVGSFTATCNGGSDNAGNSNSASITYQVIYNFTGFFAPVDNPPTMNSVKAGQAIPVKFSLGGNQGLDLFESGYPKSQDIACDLSGGVSDIEETVTAGNSSLSYDPDSDQYNYVWKSEKDWSESCRQFVLRLNDGTEHIANFQFK